MEEDKKKRGPDGGDGNQPADNDSDDTLPEAAQGEVEAALEPLGEGSTLSLGFAEVPIRSLVAMTIFVVVFMVAWMILWAAGGGLGLGLGWILAGVAGALTVKLYLGRLR